MKKLSMDELNRLSVTEFKNTKKIPLVLVLDNVRSMMNVGSVFRTSDAFMVEKVFLCGFTGTPPHKEIEKTALGATESVAWEHAHDTVELVKKLKQENFKIWAVEQTSNSTKLHEFTPEPDQKYALILGNEVMGVDEEVLPLCDGVLEIPQFGTKHSLNISVACGVVAWHFLNKFLEND